MEVSTASDQLFFVTAHLAATGTDGSQWTGTGFVYATETSSGTAHFLVTNRHVLEGVENLVVRMIKGTDGAPELGKGSEITIQGVNPDSWQGHPDDRVDVAVMPLLAVLVKMNELGAPPFFRSVAPELCLTVESSAELDSIEDVTFIGYPSGIFDSANLLPVARRGTTASPPSVDYEGLPAFLIDAAVFPGSSGSPVFLVDKGLRVDRSGGVVLGSPRLICLGVLAAVHVRSVEGKITQVQARLAVSFEEPIGLGIVYKAVAIEECVDEVLNKTGLTRAATPTSQPDAASDADRQIDAELPPMEDG